jgi:hypothetical protein
VLSDLLGMRAADPRRTPAIHLLLRQQQHELEEKDDAFLAAAEGEAAWARQGLGFKGLGPASLWAAWRHKKSC